MTALDEVAWLFNLRGSDIVYNPVFRSFAYVSEDKAILYVDQDKINDKVATYLANDKIQVKTYDAIADDLRQALADVMKHNSSVKTHDLRKKCLRPATFRGISIMRCGKQYVSIVPLLSKYPKASKTVSKSLAQSSAT